MNYRVAVQYVIFYYLHHGSVCCYRQKINEKLIRGILQHNRGFIILSWIYIMPEKNFKTMKIVAKMHLFLKVYTNRYIIFLK